MSASPSSRDRIRSSARDLFLDRGFAGASVRAIAGEAGVDAALVIRYFGSKELLFLEVMESALDSSAFFDGPLEHLGEQLVDAVLEDRDGVRSVYLALARASDAGEVGSRLRIAHERGFVEPLAARLDGPDAELRARLAAAALGGLLYSIGIVGDADVLTDPPGVRREYGAVLQRLLTP